MVQKYSWLLLQVIALCLLLCSVPLGYLLDHSFAGWLIFLFILFLHLGELLVTIPLARQRKLPMRIAVFKTLLFGFTWWVPYKRDIR